MSANPGDIIAQNAIPFSPESLQSLGAAVDKLIAAIGPAVHLIALGEPTQGDTVFLTLRNQIFRHLVETHNCTAIANPWPCYPPDAPFRILPPVAAKSHRLRLSPRTG